MYHYISISRRRICSDLSVMLKPGSEAEGARLSLVQGAEVSWHWALRPEQEQAEVTRRGQADTGRGRGQHYYYQPLILPPSSYFLVLTPALSKISGLGLKDNADRSHLARGTKPSATGPYWHSVTHLTFLSGERGDAVL